MIPSAIFGRLEATTVERLGLRAPMNATAPRRGLAKSLEVIAEFVTADATAAPAEFVRELASCWKERGGLVAGKPRHSDRYLDDLLRLLDTPIRSLTPKLGGRTNLKEADAEILIRVFLTHWTYTGEELGRGGTITAPSSDLYEPMLPEEDIAEVSTYLGGRIKASFASATELRSTVEPAQTSTLPGEDMSDLIVKEFQEAEAMFVVGAGQTMLVAQPETALIAFRNLMDRLWAVEKGDQRGRMLIWMLELGRQRFEDPESRFRFLNVEQVLSRFKALKRFKESSDGVPEARWNWLRSKALIVLHDTSSDHPPSAWLPAFDAHHVLFSAVPVRWVNSRSFRTLYAGDDDEMSDDRMSKASYTIFLKKTPESPHYELRYFGNALLIANERGERELRGLELIPPGESYTEALGTVFVAGADLLGLSAVPSEVSIDKLKIRKAHAKERLRHHGFLLFSLDEFMSF